LFLLGPLQGFPGARTVCSLFYALCLSPDSIAISHLQLNETQVETYSFSSKEGVPMKRCILGFSIVLVICLSGHQGIAAIYFGGYGAGSGNGILYRANSDGSNVQTVLSGLPWGIQQFGLDLGAGKLYWIGGGIQRINLDGTGWETIIPGPLDAEQGMAVDPIGHKVYWSERDTDRIQRANFDGSGIETVLTGVVQPRHLALDIGSNKIYWAQSGDRSSNVVERAKLNGTNIETLETGSRPSGVALDLNFGKIYWTDYGTATIERANLDGSGRQLLVSGIGGSGPGGPALDLNNGMMYWTEDANGIVRMATLDGANSKTIVDINGLILKDVVFIPDSAVPEPSTFAIMLGMSAICLLVHAWRYSDRSGRPIP
jgi:hypothetical protein